VFEEVNEGTDKVFAGVNWVLDDNVERLTLTGSAALSGTGNGLGNLIVGNGAANVINGKAGSDFLTGGGGSDVFVFDTTFGATNLDTIADFVHGVDKIRIAKAVAVAIGTSLTVDEFKVVTTGHAPSSASVHLIYNSKDGSLWYDANGSGNGGDVKMAVLTGSPDNLSYLDFAIA